MNDINEDYSLQRKEEAAEIDREYKQYRLKLHCIDLNPVTPEEYYDSLKDRREMEKFREPPKMQANKEAGISFPLKVKSIFDDGAKKELNKKKQASLSIHEKNVEEARKDYNVRAEAFYKSQAEQHSRIDAFHEMMRAGDTGELLEYIRYVLFQDRFTIDFQQDYEIQITDLDFDAEKKELSYAYRVPETDEILTFQDFRYDEENDAILPTPIDKKHQLIQRTSVIRQMLLRSMLMIYESDLYRLINNVKCTGYIYYFDEAYGTDRRKDVISFHISRDDYSNTDFTRVNIDAFFKTRIKPKMARGLYDKPSEDIKGID